MEQPKRRFVMTLTLGADSMEDLRRSLRDIAFELDGWDSFPYHSVSGSPDAGYTVHIDHNPNETHDTYFEKLNAYIAEKESATPEDSRG